MPAAFNGNGIPLVIMTSDRLRHRFFVNFLAARFPVRGVVSEAKRPRFSADRTEAVTSVKEDKLKGEKDTAIQEHFFGWDRAEAKYFGHEKEFAVPEEDVMIVPRGGSNTPEVFEWVEKREPRYLIFFGTSIIRDPLLSAFDSRAINMHLGLSPYYRGTATNFWPLVEGLPECVGVTVHLATSKVDGGPILGQARPVMAAGDSTHDIGCKTIIAGAELIARIIPGYDAGQIAPVPQRPGGKMFRQRDFSADAVIAMCEHFSNGLIDKYLAEKDARDAKYPIIN